MKLVTAIIRERKLDEVREALVAQNITRITVIRVSGHGQQVKEQIYRGKKYAPNLIPKVKIEIVVNPAYLDITIATIIKAARSNEGKGEVGDGKIFVTEIENCIRIRTGEEGEVAV